MIDSKYCTITVCVCPSGQGKPYVQFSTLKTVILSSFYAAFSGHILCPFSCFATHVKGTKVAFFMGGGGVVSFDVSIKAKSEATQCL